MTRHNFQINKPYAAKLIRVAARPIDNDPNLPLQLIRLEFAIYWMAEGRKLESQGEIACRDLIVSELLPKDRDAGLVAYAHALRVATPIDRPKNWIRLEGCGRWVELRFGPRDSEGGRNPFKEIRPFDPEGWTMKEYRYDRSAGWVSIGAAADAVGVSHSTVRRHLDDLENKFGAELIHRTGGGHRRVFLPFFMNVWQE